MIVILYGSQASGPTTHAVDFLVKLGIVYIFWPAKETCVTPPESHMIELSRVMLE